MRTKFISMLQTCANVMTRPGVQTFAAERSKSSANLKTALAWILLAGVFAALLDILLTTLTEKWVIPPNEVDYFLPSDLIFLIDGANIYLKSRLITLNFEFAKLYGWLWVHSGLFDLAAEFVYGTVIFILEEIPGWQRTIAKALLSPVSFLVRVGIFHCVVTFWGGRGQFGRYAYLFAAIAVPITFLNSLLDFLPLAAARLVAVLPGSSYMAGQYWYYFLLTTNNYATSLIVLAYWLVLIYFSTKVEHEMTWWRAVIGVVTSYLVFYVFWTVWPSGIMGLLEAAKLLRE
ncbi:MAG: hypothetical protein OXK78_20615 [Caldilineaceae bacterium]|nr:hypothetical protein [Caldilineaceae bacterium]